MDTITPLKSPKFSDPWYAGHGLVYFVAAGDPPVAIKIGVTKRNGMVRRLRAIQGSNHETIELFAVMAFETGDRPLFEESSEKVSCTVSSDISSDSIMAG